jgi:uncharacterized protein (TIGR02001 family)
MGGKMNHKIMKTILLIATLTFVFVNHAARAEDGGPEVSAEVGVFNKYIWRGYELNNDSIVIQPSLTLSYKGLSANGWANIDTDSDVDNTWNETDYTLSYDTSVGPVSLGGGYIYYNMVDADDTQELYVRAGYDTLLAPTLTVYRDIDAFPGYYINLGFSHSINLIEEISLDLSGGLGYYISCDDDIVQAGTDKKYDGLQDGLISAGLTIPVAKYLTISPSMSYSFALTDEAVDSLGISESNLYGGVVLSLEF